MNRRITSAAALFAAFALNACSSGADPDVADLQEVTVTMGDFWFEASESVFQAGVPYRFVLRNEGRLAHELAVVPRGDEDEGNLLFEVEEDDLPAGATITREFIFPAAGEYDFACFISGHYEGGMVIPVQVVAAD